MPVKWVIISEPWYSRSPGKSIFALAQKKPRGSGDRFAPANAEIGLFSAKNYVTARTCKYSTQFLHLLTKKPLRDNSVENLWMHCVCKQNFSPTFCHTSGFLSRHRFYFARTFGCMQMR
jgi:hypothetical protein